MIFRCLAATLLLIFLAADSTQADVVTYSNRSAFQSDLQSSQFVDFEDNHASNWNNYSTASGYTEDGVNFVGHFTPNSGYYLYVGESSTNNWGVVHGMNTGDFLLGEGRGSIDITLPAGNNAIGMDFIVAEGVAPGSIWNVTFELFSGESFSFDVAAAQTHFFGVTSDSEITGINFKTTLDTRPPQIAIDNVTFGTAFQSIPEPTGALAIFASICALAIRRRKGRRT